MNDESKTWSHHASAVRPAPKPLLALLILLVGGALTIAGLIQMVKGIDTLNVEAFDPAKPPAPSNPTPAILRHLEAMPATEAPLRVRKELETIVADARAKIPQRLDAITTLAGAHLVGVHVGYDYRIELPRRIDDIAAFRETAKTRLRTHALSEYCATMGPELRASVLKNGITSTHAYTLNDGKETIFIDLSPQSCPG